MWRRARHVLAWLPTSVRPRASPPPCLPWSFHLLELDLELDLVLARCWSRELQMLVCPQPPWTGRFRVVFPFFFDLRGATGDPVRIGFLRNQGEKKATEVCRARLPVTRPVPMPS